MKGGRKKRSSRFRKNMKGGRKSRRKRKMRGGDEKETCNGIEKPERGVAWVCEYNNEKQNDEWKCKGSMTGKNACVCDPYINTLSKNYMKWDKDNKECNCSENMKMNDTGTKCIQKNSEGGRKTRRKRQSRRRKRGGRKSRRKRKMRGGNDTPYVDGDNGNGNGDGKDEQTKCGGSDEEFNNLWSKIKEDENIRENMISFENSCKCPDGFVEGKKPNGGTICWRNSEGGRKSRRKRQSRRRKDGGTPNCESRTTYDTCEVFGSNCKWEDGVCSEVKYD